MLEQASLQENHGKNIVGMVARNANVAPYPDANQQPHCVETHADIRQVNTAHVTWATAAQWTQYRPKIERLYLQEHKTLREVTEIMLAQYGFRATYVYSCPIPPFFEFWWHILI